MTIRMGGITWWRGNYGSVLQAYALARVLNSYVGVEYEIIDQYGSIHSAVGVLRRMRGKSPREVFGKLVSRVAVPEFGARAIALGRFIDREIPVSKQSFSSKNISDANEYYDAFCCGSDQIWNPACTGLDEINWLSFVEPSKRLFSYAPSIGVASLDDREEAFVREHARRFNMLSCREEEGAALISRVSGMQCRCVLDPTLLIPAEEWMQLSKPGKRLNPGYVFAYILRGTERQRRFVEEFAASRGLRVVCLPYLEPNWAPHYEAKFGDERLFDCDPFDLIAAISGASFVFTDSFHCTVFSILTHRSFALFPKAGKAQSSRLENLQRIAGIEDRTLEDEASIEDVSELSPIDWAYVDQRFSEARKPSLEYIDEAIGMLG